MTRSIEEDPPVSVVRRGPARRSPTGARRRLSDYRRPLAGLVTTVVVLGIIAVAAGLFRGSFTPTVPVTVVSPRAGLVMNPEAKVKMHGVQVGTVGAITSRPDGSAVLQLQMDPSQLRLIPANVHASIASSTVFGAKFVELVAPPDPSTKTMYAGQVLDGEHVMVEINTVFQQLTRVLDKIDPMKLNETLGAISTAFDGRGEQIGQALSDFDTFLGKIEPSLPQLETEVATMPPVFSAYADAAPDLTSTVANATTLSNSIVEEQHNLDGFLLSSIGLADVSNEVLGGNRQALTTATQVLLPTAALLDKYHEHLGCAVGGLVPFAKTPPFPVPGIIIAASFTLGSERYRYPNDLPRVAAKADRSYCHDLGLPEVPAEYRVPWMVADTGANPNQYGNQGLLLNSDALKQALFGPLGGPPRNSAQVGMPG